MRSFAATSERGVVGIRAGAEPRRVVGQAARRRARAVDESALAVRAARGDPLADDDEQPRHDHHGGDDGRLEIGRCGEHRDRHEEEELHHEPRNREAPAPWRLHRAHPHRALASNGLPLLPARTLAVARGQAPGVVTQRVQLGLEPADLHGERANGAEQLILVGRRVLARDLGRLGRVRHARSLPLVGRAHVVECGAGVVVHFRPPLLDRRLGDDGTAALRLVGARLGQLAPELVGGVDCGRLPAPAGATARLSAWRRCRQCQSARIPSAINASLISLRTGRWYRGRQTDSAQPRDPPARWPQWLLARRLLPSARFLLRPGSVRSRRRIDRRGRLRPREGVRERERVRDSAAARPRPGGRPPG